MALTLACSKSFSDFLIICLALEVSKVDFNLMLTGIKSLWIHLREKNPSLNNNIGKFNLSHIWDRVLLNTKGLILK